MAIKVFISWSGEISRKLASEINDWLPSVLQFVKPYFSPDDVEKGAKWNSEISKELENSNVGIICLTYENFEMPWILFETGALSKSMDRSRVCTLLFNLETSDLKGPLTSFQSTKFNKDDIKRLVCTINNAAGESKLDSTILDNVFEMWWPKLEKNITEILETSSKPLTKDRRSERDILEEILELSRINVKNSPRSDRISPDAIKDIVKILSEILQNSDNDSLNPITLSLFGNIGGPLKYLCNKYDCIEEFEIYLHFLNNLELRFENLNRISKISKQSKRIGSIDN